MNAPIVTLPVFTVPDAGSAHGLIQRAQTITSFNDVARWDKEASHLAENFRAFLAKVPEFEAQIRSGEAASKAAHSQKPFFQRLFSVPPLTVEIRRARQTLQVATTQLGPLADQLEALIDQTPDNPSEKKELLSELKGLKKELNLEKKELAAAMRQVRANARRANANVGGFFSTPKSRRYERISIRLDKEAALRPHEGAKETIERQILEIDRMILWIERIK